MPPQPTAPPDPRWKDPASFTIVYQAPVPAFTATVGYQVDVKELAKPVEAPHAQSIGSGFIIIVVIEFAVVLLLDINKVFADIKYGIGNVVGFVRSLFI